jgi:hypothetical protein
MKKIAKFHGIEVDNARDVFREANKLKIIEDAER